jgi:tetratricopeptide (TPR) repeat protein
MAELGLLLPEALEKVNTALESGEDIKILDTKAEVLWKLGRVDEALEVISKCIQVNPENQHYQDQKEKFLNTRAI